MANDALGMLAQDRETGTDAVSGIVHGRQAGPVVRPTVHVLLMTAAEKLKPAEFALVAQFLDEKILAAIDDRLHHHVNPARSSLGLDQLFAFLNGGGHWHRAGDVLARFESGETLSGMIGNWRVDVYGVNVGILEQLVVIGEAVFNPE